MKMITVIVLLGLGLRQASASGLNFDSDNEEVDNSEANESDDFELLMPQSAGEDSPFGKDDCKSESESEELQYDNRDEYCAILEQACGQFVEAFATIMDCKPHMDDDDFNRITKYFRVPVSKCGMFTLASRIFGALPESPPGSPRFAGSPARPKKEVSLVSGMDSGTGAVPRLKREELEKADEKGLNMDWGTPRKASAAPSNNPPGMCGVRQSPTSPRKKNRARRGPSTPRKASRSRSVVQVAQSYRTPQRTPRKSRSDNRQAASTSPMAQPSFETDPIADLQAAVAKLRVSLDSTP